MVSDFINRDFVFKDFNFLVFQLHCRSFLRGSFNRACKFVVMLIKSDIAIKQCRGSVNALFRTLVLDWDNIAVAVRLNTGIRQAPFQDLVIVINDTVRLQVRA